MQHILARKELPLNSLICCLLGPLRWKIVFQAHFGFSFSLDRCSWDLFASSYWDACQLTKYVYKPTKWLHPNELLSLHSMMHAFTRLLEECNSSARIINNCSSLTALTVSDTANLSLLASSWHSCKIDISPFESSKKPALWLETGYSLAIFQTCPLITSSVAFVSFYISSATVQSFHLHWSQHPVKLMGYFPEVYILTAQVKTTFLQTHCKLCRVTSLDFFELSQIQRNKQCIFQTGIPYDV